jgi:cell shape-determining protein MreD
MNYLGINHFGFSLLSFVVRNIKLWHGTFLVCMLLSYTVIELGPLTLESLMGNIQGKSEC